LPYYTGRSAHSLKAKVNFFGAIFQNGAFFGPGSQALHRVMPAREHPQEFIAAAFG
jgi:hypothetical protein